MSPRWPEIASAATTFASVIVVVLAPGTVALTAFVQRRLAWTRGIQISSVYTTVTLGLALVGLIIWPEWLGSGAEPPLGLVASIAVGAALTWPVTRVDAAVSRRLAALVSSRNAPVAVRRPAGARARVVPAGIAGPATTASRPGVGPPTARGRAAGDRRQRDGDRRAHRLVWLLAVALAEELLFRGALVGWSATLALPLEILACGAITVVFLLLHSGFGWHQVVAKVPLALATLAVALGSGTVWGAVVLHCLFNLWYWRRQSWLASSPVGTAATA
jgi:hypothetical protein